MPKATKMCDNVREICCDVNGFYTYMREKCHLHLMFKVYEQYSRFNQKRSRKVAEKYCIKKFPRIIYTITFYAENLKKYVKIECACIDIRISDFLFLENDVFQIRK